MKRIPFILLFLMLMPFHSCEDEGGCTGIKVARVGAGFYLRNGNSEKDTTLNNFSFYSIGRPDSLIYDSASNVHNIEFPLPNEEESHSWFVFSTGSQRDTIHIYKQSRLVLFSYACGFAANHDLLQVDGQNIIIDTISISIRDVAFYDEENIKIYIKPAVAGSTP